MHDRSVAVWARILLPVGLGAAALAYLASRPPLPQDQAYHQFADQRPWLGVPHFANVVSNVPFLAIGAVGLWGVFRQAVFLDRRECWPYFFLFLGVGLTAFGSAWFHLQPNNTRLVWDRLPMAVAFMGLFAGMLNDRLGPAAGTPLLAPLLVAGVGSVLWWQWADDLRPYYLVQGGPLLATPFLLLLFPPRYSGSVWIWLALSCYVGAKVLERQDGDWYAWTGVSGHTLKHLLAALGAYCLLHMVLTRRAYRKVE